MNTLTGFSNPASPLKMNGAAPMVEPQTTKSQNLVKKVRQNISNLPQNKFDQLRGVENAEKTRNEEIEEVFMDIAAAKRG